MRVNNFQNFEMLDARIAFVLNKIIQNSNFKKKVSLEKEDRFLRGTVLDYADVFTIDLRNEDVQEFDTRWDEILFSMSKIPPMMSWKACSG